MGMNPNEPAGYPYPPPPSQGSGGYRASVGNLYQRWVAVLTRPSAETFDAEQPGANWNDVWLGLVILGVVNAVTGFITALEYSRRYSSPVGSAIGGFISAFIGFFIVVGILYLIAKAFNGTGTFMLYAYLISLFYVPLYIVSGIAGIIPILGGLVALAAWAYSVYLSVLATVSAHRLSPGQAWAVVLIPLAVAFVLFVILSIVAFAFLIALGVPMPGR